jgi:hypothetical protein
MSLSKFEVLDDLFNFCNSNHFQLMEEYIRQKADFGIKHTFPAFCVNFYAVLNNLTKYDFEHYSDGDDRDSLPMDSDEF